MLKGVVRPREPIHGVQQRLNSKSKHRPGIEFLKILGEIKAQQQELNVVKKAEPQFDGRWEKIKVTVDSGANAPVMPPQYGQMYPVQGSPGSLREAARRVQGILQCRAQDRVVL